jgi:crotonobetainyl-CoA:carnitine CoA-transferase CaiB-like acyl-CoA transferase
VIDVSLLEGIFSILGPEAAIHQLTGTLKQRVGSASHTSAPRNVYRCADGAYVALSASTQPMARRVFEAIGRPEMSDDARFSTNSARLKHRPLVDEAVGAWFSSNTREHALARMREVGVTVAPVYTIADALNDAHFREREIVVGVEDTELGQLPMHAIVPRLSGSPGVWRRPAPRLGEHTDVVLAEAGLDADLIVALKQQGAAA